MGKINFRNLYHKYFGTNAKTRLDGAEYFKLLNYSIGEISGFSGQIYDEATIRSCIHTIATHCAKLTPQHRLNKKIAKTKLNKTLYLRPNQYMSAFDFIYKIVTQLYCTGNAFVYAHYNNKG